MHIAQFIFLITIMIIIIMNIFFKRLKILNEFIFLIPMVWALINTNFKHKDRIHWIPFILGCASLTIFVVLKILQIREENKNIKQ